MLQKVTIKILLLVITNENTTIGIVDKLYILKLFWKEDLTLEAFNIPTSVIA